MKKNAPGYAPAVTPLTHERAYMPARHSDEQMTPTENGGWDIESQSFTSVRNYRELNKLSYDDKRFLFIPLWRLFLDAFTAAVEHGYLAADNWKRAFRFTDDWLALGTDLIRAESCWMSERHRNALASTMFHDTEAAALSSYQEVGRLLCEGIDWDTPRQRLRLL
jgi:hypothetical protein